MLYNPNKAIDPSSERQQMLMLYHPPLNFVSFKKRCIARIPHTIDMNNDLTKEKGTDRMLTTSDMIPNVEAAQRSLEPNLERSLEASFTKAAKHACAYVVRALDLEPIQHGTDRCPCSSLLDVLRTNDAEQKKIVHSCHIYTMQWLSERDISWCSNGFPITNIAAWKHHNMVEKEPELVKAIGAWSVDLQCDCANQTLSYAGRIDTIPCASHGLIDAKSCTSGYDDNTSTDSDEIIPKENHSRNQALARCPTDCAVDHLLMVVETDESGTNSENSSETTTDSDMSLIDEQVESLVPLVVEAIYARLAHTGAPFLVPDTGFGPSGNFGSQHVAFSSNEGTTGYHFHTRKRKRDCQGDDENDDDASENERDPPALRMPNPMPLEDPSARLACHFHVLEPHKYCDTSANGRTYKTCPTGFKDSKELRDHHKKKHCGPKYLCARCHTEFRDSAEKGAHETSRERCEPRRKVEYERERYILVGTRRRAEFERMKKSRLVSHEQHWFAVWRVLFPDKDPPASPYVQEHTDVAYFDQVVEDEILNCINGQDHLWSRNGYSSATTFLRRFAERLRERLFDETREGRLGEIRSILGDSSSRTPDDHRSTTINTTSLSDHGPMQHHAQDPVSDPRGLRSSNAGATASMPSFTTQTLQVPPSTHVPIDRSQLSHSSGGSFPDNHDSYALLHPGAGVYGQAYGPHTLSNHVDSDEYGDMDGSYYPWHLHQ